MTDTTISDSQDLLAAANGLPEQIEQAIRASRNLDNLPDRERIENVVVLGMGGAGIAGDILVASAAPFMPVPITVVKSYELPAFVGEGTLVFAISFSGDTEETVDAASDAAIQGAKIVVVSTGGQLAQLAGRWGAPVVRVPKNLPQSRSAVAALAIPALAVLEEIGLFPGGESWITLAVDQLRKRRDELQASDNFANALADRLAGKLVVIHGGGALGAAAAQRWKSILNLNVKAPAFWNAQPELCHNEIEGWAAMPNELRERIVVVSLRHDDEHPQVMRRFELTHEELRRNGVAVEEVQAEGDGGIAQLFDLVMIGDFVSLALAAKTGVDPGPTPILSALKTALRDR